MQKSFEGHPDGSALIEFTFKLSDMRGARNKYVKPDNDYISISLKNSYVKKVKGYINVASGYTKMLSPEKYGLQHYKSFGCDFGGSKLAQWRDIEGAVLQHWTCLLKGSLLVRNT